MTIFKEAFTTKNIKNKVLKKYTPAIGLVLIIFVITGYILFKSLQNNFVSQIREESKYLLNEYLLLNSIAAESRAVMSELIDERLSISTNVVLKQRSELNQNSILKLMEELKVDHISWFDSKGQILYSTKPNFVGWQTTKDHPIEKFVNSSDKYLLENIRKETISNEFYKFAYLKDDDGYFVQVGISAQSLQSIFEKLGKQSIIEILARDNPNIYIFLINNKNEVIAGTQPLNYQNAIIDDKLFLQLKKGDIYTEIAHCGNEKMYRTLVPVISHGRHDETLEICYSLESTKSIMKEVSIYALIFFTFIFLITSGIIIYITRNNTKIEFLAYYDPVTALPNKDSFLKVISEHQNHKNEKSSILLLKIEKFKIVNQIYGYKSGDSVLNNVANLLLNYSSKNNNIMIFKYFSDKYLVYLHNISDKNQINKIAKDILNIFKNPITINKEPKILNIHMSSVIFESNDTNEIIKRADIALEWPDNSSLIFYDESMKNYILKKDCIKKELCESLVENKGNLYLVFQPQQSLITDEIVGFEALLRFNSKSYGYISPEELINIAETENIIIELGKWILRDACKFIKLIEGLEKDNFRVAVNVSAIQLLSDAFVPDVIKIIEEENINKRHLELEITESVIMDNYESANQKLLSLKKHDIEISLDDFGTGYSSLARIDGLYIDKLKIDKYFISKITENDSENLIAEAIIILAKKLNLVIIAEGVEYQYQKDYLQRKNCDILQGYLFSRPISADKCVEMIL